MKYDELTLMQFVDGELDEALTAEIESARANDEELQAYLEVYETTRSALIESRQEEAIPSHISDMIDNYVNSVPLLAVLPDFLQLGGEPYILAPHRPLEVFERVVPRV